MDKLPNENDPGAPNVEQIKRAIRLYGAGASTSDFHKAFVNELNGDGMYLAWCAARTFMAMDESFDETFAVEVARAEEEGEAAFRQVMAQAEAMDRRRPRV